MNDMTSALISTVVAAVACGSAAAVIIMSSPVRAEPAIEDPVDHTACACRIPPEIILAHRNPDPANATPQDKPEICPHLARKSQCWLAPPKQISTTVLPTPTP